MRIKKIMENILHTIGHSTHPLDRFVELLNLHEIRAVCDVRSSPYSRYNPQFNRETIQAELRKHGIAYVYLGKELGPRSDDPGCYENGKAQYDRLAKTDLFQEGITRVKEGMKTFRITLMCAEKDPIMCHRTILVCRPLAGAGISIGHILDDGAVETHESAMNRLRNALKLPESDMFRSSEQMIQEAYNLQGQKIAHVKEEKTGKEEDRDL